MNEILKKIDVLIFEAHRQWTDFEEDRKHCSWDDYSMFIREVVDDKLKELIQSSQTDVTDTNVGKIEHDGCSNCLFEGKMPNEYPCVRCKRCYVDKWETKQIETVEGE